MANPHLLTVAGAAAALRPETRTAFPFNRLPEGWAAPEYECYECRDLSPEERGRSKRGRWYHGGCGGRKPLSRLSRRAATDCAVGRLRAIPIPISCSTSNVTIILMSGVSCTVCATWLRGCAKTCKLKTSVQARRHGKPIPDRRGGFQTRPYTNMVGIFGPD